MSELKPCPFCGSSQIGHVTKRNSIEYSCLCCDAAFIEGNPEISSTWERAVAVWNTRAPDPRIAELEAENAALKKQLAGKWLPIENAPRDGNNVLAIWNGNQRFAYWRGQCWRAFGDNKIMKVANQPTHWQPLPPAPKGE